MTLETLDVASGKVRDREQVMKEFKGEVELHPDSGQSEADLFERLARNCADQLISEIFVPRTTISVPLALADRAAGEWGIAVTVLVIGAAALAALAVAACKPVNRGPRKAPRTAHRGANEIKPRSRSGLLTFTVAGPLALGASLLFALAIRALILFGGGAEADANVAVLATVPIAWPVLAFALLMMSRRADQFAWVLGIAALAAPFLMFQGTTV